MLTEFFDDLTENLVARKALGLGAHMIDALRARAASPGNAAWIEITPISSPTLPAGVVASYYTDRIINAPRALRKVDDEYWVGGSGRIARFDINWTFLGYWIGSWGNVNETNHYEYPESFCIDETNGRIIMAMGGRHIVRAFDLETGDHLWTFGTPYSAGNLADGLMYNARDVDLLPNGNVVICSTNGTGEINGVTGNNNSGYVAELNGADGTFVACRLMAMPNRYDAWEGRVHYPVRARYFASDNCIYISTGRNHVGVFDADTWKNITTYTKPQGWDVDAITPMGLAIEDGELIVACNSPRSIVALGLADHDYKWHAGTVGWDARNTPRNQIGEMLDIWDILPVGDGTVLVADAGNSRIMQLPKFNNAVWQYAPQIPDGYEIVAGPHGYDTKTHRLSVKLCDLGRHGVDPQRLTLLLRRAP
jgi:hypothetical protein